MVTIQIKNEVIEWLQERLDLDADDALELAMEFAGMLYFSGAFDEPPADATNTEDPPPDDASIKARWG